MMKRQIWKNNFSSPIYFQSILSHSNSSLKRVLKFSARDRPLSSNRCTTFSSDLEPFSPLHGSKRLIELSGSVNPLSARVLEKLYHVEQHRHGNSTEDSRVRHITQDADGPDGLLQFFSAVHVPAGGYGEGPAKDRNPPHGGERGRPAGRRCTRNLLFLAVTLLTPDP